MTQMKEQIKNPENNLSDKEIGHLSDAEFKTLVIRMFTEMTEYRCQMKKKRLCKVKKKNLQGTSSEGKETRAHQWLGAEGGNKHSTRWCAKTKKYGPNERTDQNSRERIK